MATVQNNDILFDDLAAIRSVGNSNASADHSISYGDCSNRFEIQTGNTNSTSYSGTALSYGDCSN
ncbi:hypothetical protein [Mucilaginibacter pedocola]|uniref:hypothetical protein n=1 Tax=Mucilaginibacter pedocola TaxID=1792845 RepID=UPI00117D37A4|nr:hypothetical protein [Mucilaginibacter pedocola]